MLKDLEKDVRLSESMLWEIQRRSYEDMGANAWSSGGVPSYVTSNPMIAHQYASVVLGFLRDCAGAEGVMSLDRSAPIYILELGAGAGRFGYLFLRRLIQLLDSSSLSGLKIKYVMTDVVEKNIDFWRDHDLLKPYVERGELDFAFFDGEQSNCEEMITLINSGEILSRDSITNPLIALGNYFFDTIVQDFFKITNDQKLCEGRITLNYETGDAEDLADPYVIKNIKWQYAYEPIAEGKYYGDFPELDTVLKQYTEQFHGVTFPFPLGAFRTTKRIRAMSRDRLFFLTADHGLISEEHVCRSKSLSKSVHTSFSMPVNYHALSLYAHNEGGDVLSTQFPDPKLIVAGFLFGIERGGFVETHQAFNSTVGVFDSHDYFRLGSYLKDVQSESSLESMILFLKLGEWDPINFNQYIEDIKKNIGNGSEDDKNKIKEVVEMVWKNFFPVSSQEAFFPIKIGILLVAIEEYDQALTFFERALAIDKKSALAHLNIGMCFTKMKNLEKGMHHFKISRELELDF